ncbi:MAG: peptide-methionine (R)-S-oxide reductase MsrB [Burkholderiales bacterium]
MTYPIEKSDPEWKALLRAKGAEPAAFEVTRHAATERPHAGKYADAFNAGTYRCICCDKPLFSSDAKFDAGCGWPSFDRALDAGAVATRSDRSHGMLRTEALCPDCGAHLGHLFDDGPTDTGLRYCMNSASLHFTPE